MRTRLLTCILMLTAFYGYSQGCLTVENDTVCNGAAASFTASGGGGGQYKWYDAPTGGNLLHTGATYTPTLTATDTFYVQEVTSGTDSIGRTTAPPTSYQIYNANIATRTFDPASNKMYFTTSNAGTIIKSTTIYSNQSTLFFFTNFWVQIRKVSDNSLIGTSATYSIGANATNKWRKVVLDMTLPDAGDYYMQIQCNAQASAYGQCLKDGVTFPLSDAGNQITITSGFKVFTNVVFEYDLGSGCGSRNEVIGVVNDPSGNAGVITGSDTVCANATGVSYSIASVSEATSYNWTLPSGASIASGANTNSITVDFGTTSGTVEVTPTNACGDGLASNMTVVVESAAGAAGVITGTDSVCSGTTGVGYSISSVTGATGYSWTLPSGAAIASGDGTESITVDFGITSGTVEVTPTHVCGNGAVSNMTVVVESAAQNAGVVSGSDTVCDNTTGASYSIAAVTGATGYTWTVPTGATIASGDGTENITIDFGTTSGTVEVTPTHTCGDGTASNMTVEVMGAANAAGAITGLDSICSNQQGVSYSIAAVTGATGYTWTVPTGATIASGDNSNIITVNFGTTPGTVEVTPTHVCGNGTASNMSIVVRGAFGTGSITGTLDTCASETGVPYSVPVTAGANSFSWSLPTGATIASGDSTNAITVDFGTIGGTIQVIPNGICGAGTPSSISVSLDVGSVDAGAITGTDTVCLNTTGAGYSIAAVTGATGYTWTVPTGATIASGDGTENITIDFGTTSGTVEVTPTSICGDGAVANMTVEVDNGSADAGVITGSDTVCSNATGISYSIAAVTGATGYTWTVPAGATIASGDGTESITIDFGTTSGTVEVTPTSICGDGAVSNMTVEINSGSADAGVMTGTDTVCANTTGVSYSIAGVTGATGYTWTVPTGATIASGDGTESITIDFGTTSGTVEVTPMNTCGDGAVSNFTVVVNGAAVGAGAITGTDTVCLNTTGVSYSIAAVTGATGYTWTVPTGATIASGDGTESITIDFGTTSGTVEVTPTSTCGNGAVANMTVEVDNGSADAGVITGSDTVCSNATGVSYSIAAVTGATGYTWTVPTGATIVSGDGTESITIDFGTTSGTVEVRPTSICGDGAVSNMTVEINSGSADAGVMTGTDTVCANTTGVSYSIAGATGATGYTWTVPTGATIASGDGTESITVDFGATGGTVEVTPTNTCGNGAVSNFTVVVNGAAVGAGAITGTDTVCLNTTGVSYSIAAVTGATGYTWTVPTGATIASGDGTESITIDFGMTSGTVEVTPTSICGDGAVANMTLEVDNGSADAGVITGSDTVCSNATGISYSIAAVTGATGYTWTVPTGATIASGDGTESITIDFGTTSGTVEVTPTSVCGDGAVSNMTVEINSGSADAGVMTGTDTVCANTSGVSYSIAAVTGATGYTWTVPTGATIASGDGTESITIDFGATGGTVEVTPTNTCGNGAVSNFTVVVNGAAVGAGAITGTDTVCLNTTGVSYSIAAVTGATGYTWTVPTGATIASGDGTESITIDFATTGGLVEVTPVSDCGNGASAQFTVVVDSGAVDAGIITGSDTVCANTTGIVYSIASSLGATGYAWTVPAGATIVSGDGTESITVDFGITGGTVEVTPTNSCSNGAASNITVEINSGSADAGVMTGTDTVCANTTGVSYSIAAVTGATGYTWTVPAGATIASGDGTESITVDFGATGGTVEVTPTNTCGNGALSNMTVIIEGTALVAGLVTGTDTVCDNTTGVSYSIAAVTGATSYTWAVPADATIASGEGTESITIDFGSLSGNVTVTPMNNCGAGTPSSDTVVVNTAADAAGAITGIDSLCATTTGVGYSIATVAGATGYTWTVPTGATIASGDGTENITIDFGTTSGTVEVTPQGTCGAGTASSLAIEILTSPGAAIVSGSDTVCENVVGVSFSTILVSGATSYTWKVPAGATIASGDGTESITVDFGTTSGYVKATPQGDCGMGSSDSILVTVEAGGALTAGPITGTDTICANAVGENYSIAALSGATGYNWTVPTGATITSGDGTENITVDFGAMGGTIEVAPISGCGTGTSSTIEVIINTASFDVGVISGPDTICGDASAVSFSVVNDPGAIYDWSVPAGATVLSGQGNSSIVVDFGTTSGLASVLVTGSNGCGTSPLRSADIMIGIPASDAGVIVGNTALCDGSIETYEITAVTGATEYEWIIPTGATITAGDGTSSITVDFTGSNSGDITVTPISFCRNGLSSTLPVVISGQALFLGAISGDTIACSGDSKSYTVADVAGATGYTWTVPTGATIISGQGTTSLVVDFNGASSGDIMASIDNACGAEGTAALSVKVLSSQASPDDFTVSTDVVCPGETGVAYEVPNDPTVSYIWFYTGTGATVTPNGNTAFVDYAADATSGTIEVIAQSNCGFSPSRALSVTVNQVATQPGNFTEGLGVVLPSQTGVVYTVPLVVGVTYSWSYSGTGATLTENGNSVTIDFAADATTGTLSVTADNGLGCRLSISRDKDIIVDNSNSLPTIVILTPTEGENIQLGNTVNFTADAADTDGSVVSVTYTVFEGSNFITSVSGTGADWLATWTPTALGTYKVIAEVTDDNGGKAQSIFVNFFVTDDGINLEPVVTITTNPLAYDSIQTITLSADVVDDGSILVFQFYVTLVGSGQTIQLNATGPDYSIQWTPDEMGAYEVIGSAVDNLGAVGLSETAVITFVGGTGIDYTVAEMRDLALYPNPVTNNAATLEFVLSRTATLDIRLRDMSGVMDEQLHAKNVFVTGTHTFDLDLSHLDPGMYILTLEGDEFQQAVKVVVE